MLDCLHDFPHVHLIVATSMEAPPVKGVWGSSVVHLRSLDADAGMQLLESRLGPEHHWTSCDQEAARKLVEVVQGNPLVLGVAAGLVQAKDLTWQVSWFRLLVLRHSPCAMSHQTHCSKYPVAAGQLCVRPQEIRLVLR